MKASDRSLWKPDVSPAETDSGRADRGRHEPRSRCAASVMAVAVLLVTGSTGRGQESGLTQLAYNHPGLVVDLGVGLWAWPVPWDTDGDGDWDLIVSCPDKPSNGVWLFENPGS